MLLKILFLASFVTQLTYSCNYPYSHDLEVFKWVENYLEEIFPENLSFVFQADIDNDENTNISNGNGTSSSGNIESGTNVSSLDLLNLDDFTSINSDHESNQYVNFHDSQNGFTNDILENDQNSLSLYLETPERLDINDRYFIQCPGPIAATADNPKAPFNLQAKEIERSKSIQPIQPKVFEHHSLISQVSNHNQSIHSSCDQSFQSPNEANLDRSNPVNFGSTYSQTIPHNSHNQYLNLVDQKFDTFQMAVYKLSGKIVSGPQQVCYQARLGIRSAVIIILNDWRIRTTPQRVAAMNNFLPFPSEPYYHQPACYDNYFVCDQMIIDMCRLIGKSAFSFADRIDIVVDFIEFLANSLNTIKSASFEAAEISMEGLAPSPILLRSEAGNIWKRKFDDLSNSSLTLSQSTCHTRNQAALKHAVKSAHTSSLPQLDDHEVGHAESLGGSSVHVIDDQVFLKRITMIRDLKESDLSSYVHSIYKYQHSSIADVQSLSSVDSHASSSSHNECESTRKPRPKARFSRSDKLNELRDAVYQISGHVIKKMVNCWQRLALFYENLQRVVYLKSGSLLRA